MFVYLNKTRIYLADVGAGEPIIFLHGTFQHHRVWRKQFEFFTQRYRCLAWDMRGHGLSGAEGRYGYADLADDLLDLLDQLGLSAAHLVGTDLGATIAMRLAVNHPERVHSLTLIGAAAKAADHTDLTYDYLLDPGLLPRLVRQSLHPKTLQDQPEIHDELLGMTMPVSLESAIKLNGSFNGFDLTARLRMLQTPAAVLGGESDPIYPPRSQHVLATTIPRAQSHTIPDAGHVPQLENPERVNQILASHLAAAVTPSTTCLELNGTPIHLVEAGSGEPVLFLHGVGLDHQIWQPQLDRFAADYHCVAWDMRGHGRSGNEGRHDYASYSDDLLDLLDTLQLPSVHIVGHSVGGRAAMRFAVDHPDRVHSLALLDTAARAADSSETLYDYFLDPTLLVPILRDSLHPHTRETHPEMPTEMAQQAAAIDIRTVEKMIAAFRGFDLTHRLRELETPTTVLGGVADPLFSAHTLRSLATYVPGARLSMVPDAGYIPQQENSEFVNNALATHLTDATRFGLRRKAG